MRNLLRDPVERYRDRSPATVKRFGGVGDSTQGVFIVPIPGAPASEKMRVIASSGGGWDHVSASLPHRCPTWSELEFVKRLFFEHDECAMQLHVPPSDHISCHPYCLHLWRPNDGREIPRPPGWMVA